MNRTFEDRKPTKVYAKSRENKSIINALNMYGRVPEQYELLEEIERQSKMFINRDKEFLKLNDEIERLNNIIKPKEVNYNYLKLLFEKKDKEEVIKSYVYKCEQLEKLYKSYEEKEIEVMKKDNIINELEKWLKEYKIQCKKYDSNSTIGVINCILNKLKELKEGK